jgi:hypothetical protein
VPEISFVNPAFLTAGAALLASPIIIHLINRMRYRRIQWAPMEFLFESQRRNRRRVLLKQLLLLLLRILIVVLFVALVARPYVGSKLAAFFGGERTHEVVVLDDSCSMNDRWADTNAFERARKAVLQLGKAAAARPGSHALTVLRLSRANQPDVLRETLDEASIARLQGRVESLQCTHGAYGLLEGVKEAERLFEEDAGMKRTLHLVSDFRSRDWLAEGALTEKLAHLAADDVDMNFVRCVPAQHQNLGVAGLEVKARNVAAGVPVTFLAQVRNHGPGSTGEFELGIVVDSKALSSGRLDPLPSGESVVHSFEVAFDQPGRHSLRVSLPQDSLPADDDRFLVLDIKDNIPVLIVNGDRDAQFIDYIAFALAPGGEAKTGIDPVIRGPEALSIELLAHYRMVTLYNVPKLSAQAVASLERYVSEGGGLVIFPGDQVEPVFYETALYRGGAGLFPAPISSPKDIPQDSFGGTGQLAFEPHPLFRVFQGERNPFIQAVRVSRVFGVPQEWKPGEGVQVLARLNTGEPFVIEKAFGAGRVMLFLAALGPEWTNWPKNPSFVITMLELQSVSAKSGLEGISQKVGAPLELEFDGQEYRRDVTVLPPTGDEADAVRITASPMPDDPAKVRATFTATYLSGLYRAILSPLSGVPEKRVFAVNTEPAEGDLRLVSKADLASRLKGVDFRFQDVEDLEWFDTSGDKHELLNLLVASLVFCLLAEQFLAYHLSYHPKSTR